MNQAAALLAVADHLVDRQQDLNTFYIVPRVDFLEISFLMLTSHLWQMAKEEHDDDDRHKPECSPLLRPRDH